MVERNYNGPVIDCTWSNGPWSNDGETVEASDDNSENGNMSTTAWPNAATSKEELTDKQQKIIETAARNPYLTDPFELYHQTDLDEYVSHGYPAQVLTEHWRGWLNGEQYATGKNNRSSKEHSSPGETNPRSKITEEDVKEMRVRARNGESASDMVDEFPISESGIRKVVSGNTWTHVDTINPSGNGGKTKTAQGELNLTTEEMRQRALDGEHATDIAEEMDVWAETVRMHLRGERCVGNPDTPPLYFDNSSDQCWKLKEQEQPDESEQATLDEQEEQEQDTPDFEPSPVTQNESSTDYTKYISIVAIVYMVYRVLRRLF